MISPTVKIALNRIQANRLLENAKPAKPITNDNTQALIQDLKCLAVTFRPITYCNRIEARAFVMKTALMISYICAAE